MHIHGGNLSIFWPLVNYRRPNFTFANFGHAVSKSWLKTLRLAPKCEFEGSSLRRIPINGLAGSLYKCAALCMAVNVYSATERTPWNIREERGLSSGIWVSISSRFERILGLALPSEKLSQLETIHH